MREIKFRAWLKEQNKMRVVYDLCFDKYDKNQVGVIDCGHDDCSMCIDYYKIEDVILMQYIGIKDINGIEIYEGDIVKDIHTTYEVQHMGQLIDYGHYEVIGNIYEHQELLKESKNE